MSQTEKKLSYGESLKADTREALVIMGKEAAREFMEYGEIGKFTLIDVHYYRDLYVRQLAHWPLMELKMRTTREETENLIQYVPRGRVILQCAKCGTIAEYNKPCPRCGHTVIDVRSVEGSGTK